MLHESDPLERLRQASQPDGIDVDVAVENMTIDKHDPEKYYDMLKQSMQAAGTGTPVKVSEHCAVSLTDASTRHEVVVLDKERQRFVNVLRSLYFVEA